MGRKNDITDNERIARRSFVRGGVPAERKEALRKEQTWGPKGSSISVGGGGQSQSSKSPGWEFSTKSGRWAGGVKKASKRSI